MDIRTVCEKVENKFQRLEYITVAHLSVKMLTIPKIKTDCGRLICFIANAEPSRELVKKLSEYAGSIAFYDDPKRRGHISAVMLFVKDSFSQRSVSEALGKQKNVRNVTALPVILDTSEQKISFCSRHGVLCSKNFSKTLDVAKKLIDI